MSVTVNGLRHGSGSRADDTPVRGRGTVEREPEEPLSGPQGGGQERKRSTAWPRGTEAGGRAASRPRGFPCSIFRPQFAAGD